MGLPGSPRDPAVRLTGKGSEREAWKTAARVLGGWESQPQGERRQSEERQEESHRGAVGSVLEWKSGWSCRASQSV